MGEHFSYSNNNFALLGLELGNDPSMQELVRSSEPHPEARLPYEWIPSLSAVLGSFVGIGIGLLQLLIVTIGGLIAGLLGSTEQRSLHEAIG